MNKPADMIVEAEALFESLRRAFPHLRMEITRGDPPLDPLMRIPQQPGLAFEVTLYLADDELHINAGSHFHVEWFPCTKPSVATAYAEAVSGILSGTFRIVEYYRGGRAVKAKLQRLSGTAWETIATWSRLNLPFPWRTATRVLQNLPAR